MHLSPLPDREGAFFYQISKVCCPAASPDTQSKKTYVYLTKTLRSCKIRHFPVRIQSNSAKCSLALTVYLAIMTNTMLMQLRILCHYLRMWVSNRQGFIWVGRLK